MADNCQTGHKEHAKQPQKNPQVPGADPKPPTGQGGQQERCRERQGGATDNIGHGIMVTGGDHHWNNFAGGFFLGGFNCRRNGGPIRIIQKLSGQISHGHALFAGAGAAVTNRRKPRRHRSRHHRR